MANSGALEMEKELYVAAMKGEVEFLLQAQNDEYLLRKTRQNRNVLHVATRYRQIEFIKKLLFEKFPNNYKLISDKEISNKNTPLHVAAEVGNSEIMSILYDYSRSVDFPSEGQESQQPPWMLKNSKGNTVVHVALVHDNLKVARFLLENNDEYATILNDLEEAPLHIAIKQHVNHYEVEAATAKVRDPMNKGGATLPFKHEREEDMSSIIELLVQKASIVASWPDTKGLTPLLRAASLGAPYNIQTIKLLVQYCPQSAEVVDVKGNSILHLLTNKIPSNHHISSLMCLREIFTLMNHQDHQGNTPLHIAVKNKDFNMVRVLLDNSPKLHINNNDGISGLSLLLQHNVLKELRHRKMTQEESKAAERGDINFLRERLTKVGLTFALSKYKADGKNLLHKLLQLKSESQIERDKFIDFIEQILDIYPELVSQRDDNGNTPIHILVQNKCDTMINYFVPENIISNSVVQQTNKNNGGGSDDDDTKTNHFIEFSLELLERCKTCVIHNQNKATKNDDQNYYYEVTWLVKNAAGNTPLHEAIIANNTNLALELLDYDQTAAGVVNKFQETPLHLLAQCNQGKENTIPFDKEAIVKMVEANREAAELADEEGVTPIFRAFKSGDVSTAATLCEVCPEAATRTTDPYRNTFWHLLVRLRARFLTASLLKIEALRETLKQGDLEGNTPLHLAIKNHRFGIVEDFLDVWIQGQSKKWFLNLLTQPNNAGQTPEDFISESTCLPRQIDKKIKCRWKLLGIRSKWGIPMKQIKTYVNSIGIIAALLATITFTAAFTVPGGLFQDTGIPIMLEKPAFHVFMISNVIAMCLSMMVLVCLLMMMATNNKRHSVIILDCSVLLLLTALATTIVTFTAGLFAAIFNAKRWLAIVTLALCGSLSLLIVVLFFFIHPLIKCLIHWMDQIQKAREKKKEIEKEKKKVDGQSAVNPASASSDVTPAAQV